MPEFLLLLAHMKKTQKIMPARIKCTLKMQLTRKKKGNLKQPIETRHSKHVSITLLRASLHGGPLELIKVIGQDYDAAWGHLESIYETRDLLLTLLSETSLDSSLYMIGITPALVT